jgi:hypothetical protein
VDRSLKFLRVAYLWLLVSLAMLLLLPVYQRVLLPIFAPTSAAAELGFSHAYYGAIRHAITVGFISMMIVGVAAKVVPTLNGLDVRALPRLWTPFLLLNAGCSLRVLGQTLTDFVPQSFVVMGMSGTLEVLGLLLWGVHLGRIMTGRLRPQAPAEPALQMVALGPIKGSDNVGDILRRDPHLLGTFIASGFTPLANPLLRRVVAGQVSIEQACRRIGLDTGSFLKQLNDASRPQDSGASR